MLSYLINFFKCSYNLGRAPRHKPLPNHLIAYNLKIDKNYLSKKDLKEILKSYGN
jgi:hypothetical protein